jgi:ABC-type protease/lipase transport system fused ATPase/permease subunit
MRFKSGKVKFVAVDEPSSALDADGELKLFERLIAVREGKTMVFVTHRFGHLIKHADQIMCVPLSLLYCPLNFLVGVLIRTNHSLISIDA